MLFLALVIDDVDETLFRQISVTFVRDSHSLTESKQKLLNWILTDAFELLLFVVVVKFGLVAKCHGEHRIVGLLFLAEHIFHHFNTVKYQWLQLVVIVFIAADHIAWNALHSQTYPVIDLEFLGLCAGAHLHQL